MNSVLTVMLLASLASSENGTDEIAQNGTSLITNLTGFRCVLRSLGLAPVQKALKKVLQKQTEETEGRANERR